jgi:hypothetical protein
MKKIIFLFYIAVIVVVVIMIAPSFKYGKESMRIINKGADKNNQIFVCTANLIKTFEIDYKEDRFSVSSGDLNSNGHICEGSFSYNPLNNFLRFSTGNRNGQGGGIDSYFSQEAFSGVFFQGFKAISIFNIPPAGIQISPAVLDTIDLLSKLTNGSRHVYVACEKINMDSLKGEYVDEHGYTLNVSPESFDFWMQNFLYRARVQVSGYTVFLTIPPITIEYGLTSNEINTYGIVRNNHQQIIIKSFMSKNYSSQTNLVFNRKPKEKNK